MREEPGVAPSPGAGLAGCPRHGSDHLLLAGPPYASPLNQILHAFKYAGAREAHAWLATLLPEPPGRGLAVWREYILVPASLHAGRKAWRGFDQAFLLAKTAGDAWGIPVAEALERRRDHPPQARLDSAARRENVRGIFRMSKRCGDLLRGRPVLLVDDVATTGSTLLQAAAALEVASPSWILALAASHGGLPDGPEPPFRVRVAR